MAYIEYHTTDRDRTCKMCNCVMSRNTWGIVMRDVHVPPKLRDIHFHAGCFMRALDEARKQHGSISHTNTQSQPNPLG